MQDYKVRTHHVHIDIYHVHKFTVTHAYVNNIATDLEMRSWNNSRDGKHCAHQLPQRHLAQEQQQQQRWLRWWRHNHMDGYRDWLHTFMLPVLPMHCLTIFLMVVQYLNWTQWAPDCLLSAGQWWYVIKLIRLKLQVSFLIMYWALWPCIIFHDFLFEVSKNNSVSKMLPKYLCSHTVRSFPKRNG